MLLALRRNRVITGALSFRNRATASRSSRSFTAVSSHATHSTTEIDTTTAGTTTTKAPASTVPPNTVTKTLIDAFANPKTSQEAKERWALGTNHFAQIVYPRGRPEIADLTKKLTEARIKVGYTGQRIPKDIRNNLRDQQAKEVLGLRSSRLSSLSSPNPHLHRPPQDDDSKPVPEWLKHKMAIKNKIVGKSWNPQRKLTRQAMEEVRYLRKQFPEQWTTAKLAEHFNVASESIRRILKTDFQLSSERAAEQDAVRVDVRKENVAASLEKLREEGHAAWLERKKKKDEARRQSPVARIRLGAPKRSIDNK
ncbi:hypothetical protein BGX28_007114 [Mortierella sp. GBA30]|nr:hypothetical protein BGX28_007114 [Mortierella sp. GBA30]